MGKDETLLSIAKQHLDLSTLDSRKSDSLDFKEQSVWGIEAALKAAYEAGQDNPRSIALGQKVRIRKGVSIDRFPDFLIENPKYSQLEGFISNIEVADNGIIISITVFFYDEVHDLDEWEAGHSVCWHIDAYSPVEGSAADMTVEFWKEMEAI